MPYDSFSSSSWPAHPLIFQHSPSPHICFDLLWFKCESLPVYPSTSLWTSFHFAAINPHLPIQPAHIHPTLSPSSFCLPATIIKGPFHLLFPNLPWLTCHYHLLIQPARSSFAQSCQCFTFSKSVPDWSTCLSHAISHPKTCIFQIHFSQSNWIDSDIISWSYMGTIHAKPCIF